MYTQGFFGYPSLMTPRASIVFLLATLAGCAASHTPSHSNTAYRPTQTLAANWHFTRGDPAGAESSTFNDADWHHVTVPHTYNVSDGADGGTYYRGPAWYRRTFSAPAKAQNDDRVYLRFGAAALTADVFLNGRPLGSHQGGYAAFAFDITDKLQPGENLLAVRVNNAINPAVPPLSGDFTVYGGIYRPVELFTTSALAITPLDDGSPGVYLTPHLDSAGNATVSARALIRNLGPDTPDTGLLCRILNDKGHEVARGATVLPVPRATTAEATADVFVPQPHRWDGVRDPYLYTAVIEVLRDRVVTDRITQPLGFRTFTVDGAKGVLLNDKPYDIHGVNKHQGRPLTGYADSPEQRAEDFKLIADLGATGVRLAHYQHSPDEYDWCDKLGLVCWAELPLVNAVTNSDAFRENAAQQLRELIKQNYNHPSIAVWSVYNEPAATGKNGTPEAWSFVQNLVKEAKDLDETRPVTGAIVGNRKLALNAYPELLAENHYPGWYHSKATDWPGVLDTLHTRYAGKPIGISEYGAGASINQHEAMTAASTRPTPTGKWHPEEWQVVVHENAWAAMAPNDQPDPQIWCKFIWVMFDFSVDSRNEGDHPGINDKGLVTADRQTKKDAFYFYQANWSTQPVLHLTSKRFNPRPPGETLIKLYSNCTDPHLTVNGADLPLTSKGHCIYEATTTLPPGKAQLKATATKDGHPVTDDLTWNIVPGAATRQSSVANRP